jgi:heat shock protein HslJ
MTGVVWQLNSIVTAAYTIDFGDLPSPATTRFLFHVERSDRGIVEGFGGCNSYEAEYRALRRERLTIGSLQRTTTACQDERDALELTFLSRLEDVTSYTLQPDSLRLGTTTGDQLLFHAPGAFP